MSEETPKTSFMQLAESLSPTLLVSVAGGAVLVALFAMLSLVLLLSLSSDMSRLEDQIRKAGKVAKGMEQEMVQLRALLAPITAAKQAEADGLATPPKPTNIDAVDKSRDCVIRAGDKAAIADCLK
jgi:hypothetical protein